MQLADSVRDPAVALPSQGGELMPADVDQRGQWTAGEQDLSYSLTSLAGAASFGPGARRRRRTDGHRIGSNRRQTHQAETRSRETSMFGRRRSFLAIVALTAGTAAVLVRWIRRKPTRPSYLASLLRQAHHLPGRYRV
jgi:hypothetical protein